MAAVEIPRSLVSTSRARLKILDQRGLPERVAYLECSAPSEVISAIKNLAVRGAPAIGLAAAYGLLLGLDDCADEPARIQDELVRRGQALIAARPTAVNLSWAVEQMLDFAATEAAALADAGWRDRLYEQATKLFEADRAACRAIGIAGAALLKDQALGFDPLQCGLACRLGVRHGAGPYLPSAGRWFTGSSLGR